MDADLLPPPEFVDSLSKVVADALNPPQNPIIGGNLFGDGEIRFDPLTLPRTVKAGCSKAFYSALSKTRPVISLPAVPEERSDWPAFKGDFWALIDEWADGHGIDPDLALLIAASTAGHAALLRVLDLSDQCFAVVDVPMLIGSTDDVGFQKAVEAACEPVREVEQLLDKKYSETRKAAEKILKEYYPDCEFADPPPPVLLGQYQIHWRGCQAFGHVRITTRGKIPRDIRRSLKHYHGYAMMCTGDIECLPTDRRTRLNLIDSIMGKIYTGPYQQRYIGGFIRFRREDYEWILKDTATRFSYSVIPVSTAKPDAGSPRKASAQPNTAFDLLHKNAIRKTVPMRFQRENRRFSNILDDEAISLFERASDIYAKETLAINHVVWKAPAFFPLFVWYALLLATSNGIRIDFKEVIYRSLAAARRLRRRFAELHDCQETMRVGLRRRRTMLKLIKRLHALGGEAAPRDLARGMHRQKMNEIHPLIDFLAANGVVIRDGRKLRLTGGSFEEFDNIPHERFMPEYRELYISAIVRLDRFEKRLAEQAANAGTPELAAPTIENKK